MVALRRECASNSVVSGAMSPRHFASALPLLDRPSFLATAAMNRLPASVAERIECNIDGFDTAGAKQDQS